MSTGPFSSNQSVSSLSPATDQFKFAPSPSDQKPSEERKSPSKPEGKKESTKTLSKLKHGSGKPAKLENIWLQFIRGGSKLMKKLYMRRGALIGPVSRYQDPLLEGMKELIWKERHLFADLVDVDKLSAHFGSFNDFCRTYFEREEVREFHRLRVDFVFERGEPAALCKRVKQYCCASAVHTAACREAWEEVRNFLKFEMFKELFPAENGPSVIEPCPTSFFPDSQNLQLEELNLLDGELGLLSLLDDPAETKEGQGVLENSEIDAQTTMEALYGPSVWEEEGFSFPSSWDSD